MDERDIPIILIQTIRMKPLVPVIRAFEQAFGKESVHAVLRQLVQGDKDDARSSVGRDPDFDRAAKAMGRFAAGDALDFKIIAKDGDRLDIDVTRCKYADLMEELDATDLGHLLICEGDYAPALRAGMELTRTQTRMQGAGHCDFRFRRR
jgi:L-2-amino-thiazoline-4-carboxylic acid hydrolase-like protein